MNALQAVILFIGLTLIIVVSTLVPEPITRFALGFFIGYFGQQAYAEAGR